MRRLAEEQRRHEAALQKKLVQLRAEQERQQAQVGNFGSPSPSPVCSASTTG